MSKTTKRKIVTREVETEFTLPTEDQQIVKVVAGRGNNLHEVTDPSGQSFLVSMPTKFRKNVWIKRGDFVVVTPIEEGDKSENQWPEGFTNQEDSVKDGLSKLDIKEDKSS